MDDLNGSRNGSTYESDFEPELLALGRSLRNIRKQKGLTLRDVESDSNGVWKAVVIGSYERGDRALTLKKAVSLARFYNVPLDHLLGLTRSTPEPLKNISINLARVRSQNQQLPTTFIRFIQEICRLRSDWNGEVLTLRASDQGFLGVILDLAEENVPAWLAENQLLLNR